ncbi:MAG: CidA/LrgA family protein [Lachnospiraceae bacterium]
MKYLKQFLIIILISFIGEILKEIIPFPVPASIYGMIIMFTCLGTGIIKTEQVSSAGDFLIGIMPVMFIPAAAGLMDSWGILKPVLLPVSVITIVSTVIVMVVSGKVTQFVLKLKN